jgi:hypothetical protein
MHRLVLVPLVLGALAAIPLFADAGPAPLAWGALTIFGLLTIGWGSMRALGSVVEEVRDRTWDFQRMSTLPPASLALGKVFGAPVFQWYIGAWCLAVFAATAPAAGHRHWMASLAAMVTSAVTLHALGVAASTASARLVLGERTRRVGGIILLTGVFNVVPVAALIGWDADALPVMVRWWGLPMARPLFVALSSALFAAWALVAAWRAMQHAMREPALPWAWPVFAAFVALWWSGLETPATARPSLALLLAAASCVLAVGTYFGGLQEPVNPVSRARMALAWRGAASANRARWPSWATNAVLAIMLGAAAFALAGRSTMEALARLALPFALMALRDMAFISCMALASHARGPVSRGVFYIALADLLLPAVAMALGRPELARLIFPMWGVFDNVGVAAGGMAFHAALALCALAVCLRSPRQGPWKAPRR